MPKVKDKDIKRLSIPSKKEFMAALGKVSASKVFPKQSKT